MIRYISIFQKFLGPKIYLIFFFAIASSLLESLGILMLLPILSGVDGSMINTSESNLIIDSIVSIFSAFAIEYTLENSIYLLVFFFLAKGAFMFLALFLILYFRAELQKIIKLDLLNHFSEMNYQQYVASSTGHFTNLINEQSFKAINCFNSLGLYVANIVNVLVYLGFAVLIDPRFTLIAALFGLILLILVTFLNKKVRSFSQRGASVSARLSEFSIQVLQAFKYLRSTNQLGNFVQRFSTRANQQKSLMAKIGLASAFVQAIKEPIAVILIMILIYIEAVLGDKSIGSLAVTIVLFYRILSSLLTLQISSQKMFENSGSIDLIVEETERIGREGYTGSKNTDFKNLIEFKNVDISYRGNKVLKDLSLQIPSFKTTALVGESGTGKTTALDMISGVIMPDSGSILIDTTPLNEINIEEWRSNIGYVAQENPVFDGTIIFNITMNIDQSEDADANDLEKIWKVLKIANLANFVNSLPEGLDSFVGDRGIAMSGGQRQRLCISRELFREPTLLILDEATSSLDSKNENYFQKSLANLHSSLTIVIVAHRLSTIKSADCIYVLEDGSVSESGNFKTLTSDPNSKLSQMVASQSIIDSASS